jgi:MFS family permease
VSGAEVGAVNPDRRRILRLSLFLGSVYFVQGLIEPDAGIGTKPILFLLKDGLKLAAGQAAVFLGVITVAWNIKPLYGLVSDFFPFFGYRRKSYLLLMTGLAGVSWLLLGLEATYAYSPVLILLTLCGLGIAFSDVLCDAVMVENGKPLHMTGRFQAIQWGAINAASVLAGVTGGWLAEAATYQQTFLLVSAFPLVSLLLTALLLDEPKSKFDREAVRATARAVRSALVSRELWIAAAFLFLWDFNPSFDVPLDYYLVDHLGFSPFYLGLLDSFEAGAAILGAVLFARFGPRFRLRQLLNAAVGVGVLTTLSYWLMFDRWSAAIVTAFSGATAMIANLATFDLAARSCPERAEGTFFAALMSIANLASAGSTFVGGWLYDWLGLTPLILLSAATSAAGWLVIPHLRIDDAPVGADVEE